ncbi:MAG: flippase [Candidatus Methanofastidiosia archaeon]|jgi:O-antigen/teichoic acid export membrane protein
MEKSAALKEIATGGTIVFMGYLMVGVFDFLYKVSVARFLSPADYGLLSIGIGVTGFAMTLSRLGVYQAFQKFIPEYRTRNMPEKIKGVILFGLGLTGILGVVFAFTMHFFSTKISIAIFGIEELIPVLKIMAFAVPAFVMTSLFLSIFLSFKKSRERVFLDSIVRSGSLLGLTGIVILLQGNLKDICYLYVLSYIITAIAGIIILETRVFSLKSGSSHIEYTRILSFSLPLVFMGVSREIMHWSDIFLIGYFKKGYYVGLYNAAHPLAFILLLALASLNSLFFPVTSELYAKNNIKSLKETYLSVTRWVFVFTFPLFLFLVFFSKDVITIFFGTEYALARYVLVILAMGTFVNAFFGAVGITLQVFEQQNFIFKAYSTAAVLNIFLNIILIPTYGIEGAAAATAAAMIFWNVAFFLKVKTILKIKYSFEYYIKYASAAIISLLPFFIFRYIFEPGIIWLVLGSLLFLGSYSIVLLITNPFSQEDVEIIKLFLTKAGLNLEFLKRIKNIFN